MLRQGSGTAPRKFEIILSTFKNDLILQKPFRLSRVEYYSLCLLLGRWIIVIQWYLANHVQSAIIHACIQLYWLLFPAVLLLEIEVAVGTGAVCRSSEKPLKNINN